MSRDSSARLYKTGDLARYTSDGNIEFLGRVDHQVKIRGFRIELGEIEARLTQHPALQQTLVMAREDVPGDKRLVAYVVPLEQVSPIALRSFLRDKLPEYMVPATFVFLDAMPLSPNGKINRLTLPVPNSVRQETEKTFVAPRYELESRMTQIWEEVLDIQPIGVRENFFDLGGHSFLAIRLFTEIETKFGIKLPLASLFPSSTIEALTQILDQEELGQGERHTTMKPSVSTLWSSLVEIQPKGSEPPLFCIHPLGGEILCYRDLARYLGSNQPVYGLQSLGLDGKPPLTRVEDMASYYIQEIQTVQPNGPYFLLGYSFGGIVAFEMAQQLHRQGEKIGILVTIDTCLPGNWKRLPFLKRVPLHLDNILRQGSAYFRQRARVWGEWGKSHFQQKYKHYLSVVHHLPENDQHLDIMDANTQALDEYTFQVYQGTMTLLRTEDRYREEVVGIEYDPQFGWGDLIARRIDVHYVPGSHRSLLHEPHIQVLAEKLQACLKGARA